MLLTQILVFEPINNSQVGVECGKIPRFSQST